MSESDKYIIAGVMSGTSLDGLDVAICEFAKNQTGYNYKILEATTLSYDRQQKNKLQAAPYLNVENYFLLHHQFGKFIGKQVNKLTEASRLKLHAVASHGHTIFHQPTKGFTTQMGCGATIAAVSNLTTVCDFRSLDVALNGQGAPLVPIGDKLLFGNYRSCLNIGGIANISFDKDEKRIAFDICIANMALNFFAKKEGHEFDKGGKMAASGKVNEALFNELNHLEFYSVNKAKSLGREWFEIDFLRVVEKFPLETKDILCTISEHCAFQIANVLNKNNLNNVLVTGGGAKNTFLMQALKKHYKGEVIIPDEKVIDFKEALIFAFLGYLRLTNQINTLSTVTGAKKDSVGGAVYYVNS